MSAVEASPTGDLLVPVTLVPVEVFGGDCECHEERQYGTPGETDRSCSGWSYGLMDAVESWSDCNRAIGRVYRVDDPGMHMHRATGETITVHVRADQVEWLAKRWGDSNNAELCSAEDTIKRLRTEIARLRTELERRTT